MFLFSLHFRKNAVAVIMGASPAFLPGFQAGKVNFQAVIKLAAAADLLNGQSRVRMVNQGSEWSIKGQNGQSRVGMVNLESEWSI